VAGHDCPQCRPQEQQVKRRQGAPSSKRQGRRRPPRAYAGLDAVAPELGAMQLKVSLVAKQPHVVAICVVLLIIAASWMLTDRQADDEHGPAMYGARPTVSGGGGRRRAHKGSEGVSIESPRSHAAIASRTQAERAVALLFEGCPRSGQAEFCGAFRPNGVHRGFPHYMNSVGTHLYRHTGRQKWHISPYFTPDDDLSKVRMCSYSCSIPHRWLGSPRTAPLVCCPDANRSEQSFGTDWHSSLVVVF